mmetsp:Transcript_19499/g.36866  ORF Transcript_19499/g.36866 Transcript_19499/m.36866 type:complete len:459 (-) Transcript_19499:112-1488(-)
MNIVCLILFTYLVLSKDSFARGDSIDNVAADASCDEPKDGSLDHGKPTEKDHHDHSPRVPEREDDDADMDHFDSVDDEDEEEDDNDDEEEKAENELYYKVWERTEYTVDEFTVAGINIADFGKVPLFQLFDDFDISSMIRGDEDWPDLMEYRNGLTRPTLSFYVDKVARKRWLPTMGFPQPKVHFLSYANEMTETGELEDEKQVIRDALPTIGSYCAKPTHMSLTKGTWLVDHLEDGSTRFSVHGRILQDHGVQSITDVIADKLAESLHEKADEIESYALREGTQPGLVVEERWVAHDDPNAPPHEFNMFTIWGKVFVGQWNTVQEENRYCDGFIYRNRTLAEGFDYATGYQLPDWVPWDELVEIAEHLGANKDMFRTDIFVGRPASAEPDSPLQIGVSESEIFPTTVFVSDRLSREAARLWVAGYVMGIYEVIENFEVPAEFAARGQLSDINEYREK